jgi:type III restriction enzyme
VKSSLANWVALSKPILVVDEAHNNRTHLAFDTLRRLSPTCLIEMTATPVKGSNVVFHVGAQELQNEDMIKLPIVLMEHPTGWKDAVRDAILTRDKLEKLAAGENDYVRPVILFQAQPKGGEVTVDVLVKHLTDPDGEKIDRKQIAVATGEQKELDGVTIGSPLCPVRYVVTVEALKEGWDCPFAYVLCSLQNAHNAKDVEQLLGRVLRMPYAQARQQLALNRAYSHIVSESFVRVADELADRLVKNMGFNAFEADQAFAVPAQALLSEVGELPEAAAPAPVEAVISLPALPEQALPAELAGVLELRPTSSGASAVVRGEISEAVEAFLLQGCTPKQQAALQEAIERERARAAAQRSPAARGVPFRPLPQLCLNWDGELQPLDKRLAAELGAFDLFAAGARLAFTLRAEGRVIEIDLQQERVGWVLREGEQLALNGVPSRLDVQDLVRWLDRECRQVDVVQAQMLIWLQAVLRQLLAQPGLTLTALLRERFVLAEAVKAEIERLRAEAVRIGFQRALPGLQASPKLADGFRYGFVFYPDRYPGRPPFYRGRYRFQKHYYGGGQIHDLREKTEDGQFGEEYLCAQQLDLSPAVRHWVRNVEKDERLSFWLPTSGNNFYPDFVAELLDGRVLVVEYKGKHLLGNARSDETLQVGRQWQESSGGDAAF